MGSVAVLDSGIADHYGGFESFYGFDLFSDDTEYPIADYYLLQVYLTSSEKVMGKYKNRTSTKWILYFLGGIVTLLNLMLLISFF